MLQKLTLENYRNYRKFELELGKVTVLVGPNGVGKSNILEAICLLSSCRSFREEDKRNLVSVDSTFARVKGDNLEIFIQREPTFFIKTKENGVFKRHSAFVGIQKSVVFSPETMLLVTGAPKLRRRFLDIMISQKDKDYLRALIAYDKIRAQRNSLLQRICDGQAAVGELAFWDENLSREGSIIISKRKEAVGFLQSLVGSAYGQISDNNDSLELHYQGSDDLASQLAANRQKEIWQGKTLYGPHRDDLVLSLNSRLLASFASRGEIRTAVLALKIGELNYLKDDASSPLLLLDDVFSEFDASRRSHLGRLISEYQSVITTTDRDHLTGIVQNNAKIIELSNG